MTNNPFAVPKSDELPRDRWGRPLITPADGGEPKAYTRASTLGKVLDDTYHLGQWMNRMVALGMAKRADLVLRASAITDPDDRSQKKTLQEIADRAKDSAAPSKAEIGSAMHQYSERIDAGEPLSIVPEAYRNDLIAYQATLADHGLEVVTSEVFVVNDENAVAGTYDRVYRLTKDLPVPAQIANQLANLSGTFDPTIYRTDGQTLFVLAGAHIVGDLKTGSTVVLSAGSFAIQLGSYANGQPYDHSVGARAELPGSLCRELAVVLHMPAGKGTCTLYWLNIHAGYHIGLPLTVQVREWRTKQKDLIAASSLPAREALALSLPEQINQCTSVEELTKIYMANKSMWTPGLTNLASARKSALLANP